MMPRERVQCPGCLRNKPIRKDGTMAKHRIYRTWPSGYVDWSACSGTWRSPGRHRRDVPIEGEED